ncbi:hypothetical protein HV440_04230 [Enterococcus faecium]|nr:hypothetical protein [Enterococcus faecium]NVD82561.1 hypothetical protein [Enterococcus faecium]NVF25334.1 hypothetical protein [Enterococcus faecium]
MKEGDKKTFSLKRKVKNKNKNERGRKIKKWILSATLIILLRAFADVRVIEQSGFTGRRVAFPML